MLTFFINIFKWTTALLLLITAVAKIVAAFGTARILLMADPVILLPFRYVLILAALIELVVVSVCVLAKRDLTKITLIAWLSTIFLMYRMGRMWVGYREPCSCMGTLTDALHMSPYTGDVLMKFLLTYLFIGSYAILLYLRCRNTFPNSNKQNGNASGNSSIRTNVG